MTLRIAIPVFHGFTALDAVGPYAVLSNLPDAEVTFVAAERGAIRDDSALTLDVPVRLSELCDPDVIVVPGGLATRRMARDGDPVIDWIRAVHPGTIRTTSVCTGAILLAAAGVLAGAEASTHWIATGQLADLGAVPSRSRVTATGKVLTSAGVAAGIDMGLTLAADLAGPATAQAIQLAIEYDPAPPFTSGHPSIAPPEIVAAVTRRLRAAEAATLARSTTAEPVVASRRERGPTPERDTARGQAQEHGDDEERPVSSDPVRQRAEGERSDADRDAHAQR